MIRLFSFIFLLLFYFSSTAQTGYLFIKKGGKKKQIFYEGDVIKLRLKDGRLLAGYISMLKNDSIFIQGQPVPISFVMDVLLPQKPKIPFPDAKTLALITAGSALTSLGLSLNNHQNRSEALIAGPVIGFGPLLVRHFGSRAVRAAHRKKFRVGKKFHLQVLDFYLPVRKGF